MGNGAITLADLEGRLAVLELRCGPCQRFGRYRMATLIEQFGRDTSIIIIREALAAKCPKREQFNIYELCRARWSDDVRVALYGEQRARELAEWRETSKGRRG